MRTEIRFFDNKRLFVIVILALLLAIGLSVFVHEFSHFIIAKIFGWEILEVNITFGGGLVRVRVPENDINSWKIIVLYLSGSVGTLLFGLLFLLIGLKNEMNLRFHFVNLVLFLVMVLDIITYIFFDFFFNYGGDFVSAFEINKNVFYIYYFFVLGYIYLFYSYSKKYSNRIINSPTAFFVD